MNQEYECNKQSFTQMIFFTKNIIKKAPDTI